jgi:signal transduction histidine kinase/CheY-like chemotaxis protein
MRRLSIARSLRLALVALTLVLAGIAALGVANLYSARQRYERILARTSQLSAAAANLQSAAILEDEELRDLPGPTGAAARGHAISAYDQAGAAALALARGDGRSVTLVQEQIAAQRSARALSAAGSIAQADAPTGPVAQAALDAAALQTRQRARAMAARRRARSDSRRALLLVAIAGALALLGALSLIYTLVAGMRRPLDELVGATGDLATGMLSRRVRPAGPRELRELGAAFNAMADELDESRRRVEAERRRLAVTIESLADGLLVSEDGAIVAANPRARELVPELEVGSRIGGEGPLPPLVQALAREQVIEHRGRTLAITAGRLGDDGAGVVWTLRDMSERAALERAKSDFVATASHELRSPLTSIKGFVELLDRQAEGMSARQREFVGIILRSTDRLVELVDGLLDVARIDAGHAQLELAPVDVAEAAREVVGLLEPRIAAKRQQLDVEIAPALPLARADAGRLRQIVSNLLTNAHLYTPAGGHLHVSVDAAHTWVQIVVADSGVGMTSEELEHVFERFYRGPSGAREAPGTGLGLSIVKSLVDLHGGRIAVSSEPGRGTTFRVRLPVAPPRPGRRQPPEPIPGGRVLVVDDDPEVAALIAAQLAPLEVSTAIARSGADALELLGRERFDAVTLDVLMPGMDGFALLRRLRENPELHGLPVVFVSAVAHHDRLAGEWRVGKPINPDELRTVLVAAVAAGRSRVLVVGRDQLRAQLEGSLRELGIEYEWETSGAAAARACRARRFEVALVDAGVRNPRAVLEGLELRGRRVRRAVILFSDDAEPDASLDSLGLEVVPVEHAAGALLATLERRRAAPA